MICLTLMRLMSAELRNENETEETELDTECAMFIAECYHLPAPSSLAEKIKPEQAQPHGTEPHDAETVRIYSSDLASQTLIIATSV